MVVYLILGYQETDMECCIGHTTETTTVQEKPNDCESEVESSGEFHSPVTCESPKTWETTTENIQTRTMSSKEDQTLTLDPPTRSSTARTITANVHTTKPELTTEYSKSSSRMTRSTYTMPDKETTARTTISTTLSTTETTEMTTQTIKTNTPSSSESNPSFEVISTPSKIATKIKVLKIRRLMKNYIAK
ncbi:unnamed protein product [Leptidea sinapis]|uniref:Uncharacterized protein n=1 Tax=Leptidea sinapis TaxID=189913 RepID=A0A5E4QBN7_9NEOP|nr:unnamed protein product [Leptidea sinapis]